MAALPVSPASPAILHNRPKASRWLALLRPTFADCLIVALFLWLFVISPYGWKGLLADGDTGWHIRTGEYILNYRAVPFVDLFSFSRAGAPWFAWEWLSDILFASLFRWAGLPGIVVLSAALILTFSVLLLLQMVWRGANPLLALAGTLVGVGASSIHFLARPHLFTLVLFAAAAWMLEMDRRCPSRRVWLLVPLTMLWTSLHAGVFAFLLLLGAGTAGVFLESWLFGGPVGAARRWLVLLALCAGGTFVNPYGWDLHRHVYAYLTSDWIRNAVQEFQAPAFRTESQFQFEALLLTGVIAGGVLLYKRRLAEALPVLVFAHLALGGARHVPLLVVLAAPVAVSAADKAWRSSGSVHGSVARILRDVGEDLRPGFQRVSLWPALVCAAVVLMLPPRVWPSDFPREVFPVAFITEHRELIEGRRVLSTDQWGDYLIFSLYPRIRVFIDGRSDFYGEGVGRDYLRLMNPDYRWRGLMDRYQFDGALLPASWPLGELLKRDASWRLVDDDGKHLLFVRSTLKNTFRRSNR